LPVDAFTDRSPWWGGDLQTLRNICLPRPIALPSVPSARAFPVADGSGDCLTATLETPRTSVQDSPLIVLIHGLTGCEDSQYVRESARFHLARGRRVLRLNLRGAGSSRSVSGGYYHAGCAPDLAAVLVGLAAEDTENGVVLIGFSLGGNILLNLLGRLEPPHSILAAATVSAPIEPAEACARIMSTRNAIYHRFLLHRMKADVLSSPKLSQGERDAIAQAHSVFAFDEHWVAPRNGFGGALDYYYRTAGAQFVGAITVPTLMLHARNDPWIPPAPYHAVQARAPEAVEIHMAESGGHVGFHEKGYAETWHDRRIDSFLRARGVVSHPGQTLR
jgi:predicted alpha/beta-fold hydrolase